jgi:hypothetical protein
MTLVLSEIKIRVAPVLDFPSKGDRVLSHQLDGREVRITAGNAVSFDHLLKLCLQASTAVEYVVDSLPHLDGGRSNRRKRSGKRIEFVAHLCQLGALADNSQAHSLWGCADVLTSHRQKLADAMGDGKC